MADFWLKISLLGISLLSKPLGYHSDIPATRQEIPRLYPLHFTFSTKNICLIQNNFVPLQREPAPGMSVHRQRRVADILKRRLLRSVLTFWNVATFKIDIQDLATIDVLGMCISNTLVPLFVVRACAYISAWASRCQF